VVVFVVLVGVVVFVELTVELAHDVYPNVQLKLASIGGKAGQVPVHANDPANTLIPIGLATLSDVDKPRPTTLYLQSIMLAL
jgi:hypothetical protein